MFQQKVKKLQLSTKQIVTYILKPLKENRPFSMREVPVLDERIGTSLQENRPFSK